MKTMKAGWIVVAVVVLGASRRVPVLRAEPADKGEAKREAPKEAPREPSKVTAKELQNELENIRLMMDREDQRYERQLAMLRRMKGAETVRRGGGNPQPATEAIEDEKNRHQEQMKKLGEQWLVIKNELDAIQGPGDEKK